MKRFVLVSVLASVAVLGWGRSSWGQTAGTTIIGETITAFSRDVVCTTAVAVVGHPGCATRVCFSNTVTSVHCTNVYTVGAITCYTNNQPILECVTNFVTVTRCYTNNLSGALQCYTNTFPQLVCTTNGFNTVIKCYTNITATAVCTTNTSTSLVCTNDYGLSPTLRVRHTFVGPVVSGACDEAGAVVPVTAVFHASLTSDLRQPDWRGFQAGSFYITSGTNLLVTGSMTGINGADAQGDVCATCSHFEGMLSGTGRTGTSLAGSRIQASYSGNFTDATCPSTEIPQGNLSLSIEGVVIGPCAPPQ